jgi:hypothetical protein
MHRGLVTLPLRRRHPKCQAASALVAPIQDLGAPNFGISTSSISASGPSAGRSLA